MADKKQVERLRSSVSRWNAWRARYGKPVDLYRADLSGADLYGADLRRANLTEADLYGADLRGANLRRANLSGANLRGADLCGADLSGANLRGADLCGADLSGANLYGAHLREANLRGARVSPPALLLARWGDVSDDLCRDLMRYDVVNHPGGEAAFQQWADGGGCPYGSTHWLRAANFAERRECWSPGPSPSALELCERLIAEKCNHTASTDSGEGAGDE